MPRNKNSIHTQRKREHMAKDKLARFLQTHAGMGYDEAKRIIPDTRKALDREIRSGRFRAESNSAMHWGRQLLLHIKDPAMYFIVVNGVYNTVFEEETYSSPSYLSYEQSIRILGQHNIHGIIDKFKPFREITNRAHITLENDPRELPRETREAMGRRNSQCSIM